MFSSVYVKIHMTKNGSFISTLLFAFVGVWTATIHQISQAKMVYKTHFYVRANKGIKYYVDI